jgi:hypothetical protein
MAPLKTTVYLDADDYRRLKQLGRARGVTAAQLVREAVAEYAASHARRRLPRSVGAGRSASGTLSERAEELLRGLGHRR